MPQQQGQQPRQPKGGKAGQRVPKPIPNAPPVQPAEDSEHQSTGLGAEWPGWWSPWSGWGVSGAQAGDSSAPTTTTFPGVEAAVYLANREFIKGFISGQVILCILLFLLVKQFLLKSGPAPTAGAAATSRRRHLARLYEKEKGAPYQGMTASQVALENMVLTKCGYDIYTHPKESCDWLTVLLALAIAKYRSTPHFHATLVGWLDRALNDPGKKPSYMGPILLTDVRLGEEFPRIRRVALTNEYHLRAEIEFDYSDQISLDLETQALVNWPRDTMASLPISLSVALVKFAGTLCLEVISYPDSSDSFLSLSLLQSDFQLDLQVRSLLGHRTKVKDLPKLTQLLLLRLRGVVMDELVYPNSRRFKLPADLLGAVGLARDGAASEFVPAAAAAASRPGKGEAADDVEARSEGS